MSTYRVKPAGNRWLVTKSGRTVSRHNKKSRAKSAASKKADSGDSVIIHRANGTIQDRRTTR